MTNINLNKIKHTIANLLIWQRYCTICALPSTNLICNECLDDLEKINISSCLKCKASIDSHHILCNNCISHKTQFDNLYCKFSYQQPLATILHKLKYSSQLEYAKFLSYILYQSITSAPTPDLIIPIPLHRKRLIQRGFNQVNELLFWYKVQNPNVIIDNKIVTRTKNTEHQTLLTPEKRQLNMKNAFTLHKSVDGLRIVIVDDVVTTNATVNELATMLKDYGAEHVDVWCLMRAEN